MQYFITHIDEQGWEITNTYNDRHAAQDFVNIWFPDIVRIIYGMTIDCDPDAGPPALLGLTA